MLSILHRFESLRQTRSDSPTSRQRRGGRKPHGAASRAPRPWPMRRTGGVRSGPSPPMRWQVPPCTPARQYEGDRGEDCAVSTGLAVTARWSRGEPRNQWFGDLPQWSRDRPGRKLAHHLSHHALVNDFIHVRHALTGRYGWRTIYREFVPVASGVRRSGEGFTRRGAV